MTSVSVEIDPGDVARLNRIFERLTDRQQTTLLRKLAAEGESQTRRRIEEERRSPEGQAWLPWSQRYAKTRHAGQSLLQATGGLVDSIRAFVDDDGSEAGWGTRLIYAAIHQFGGTSGMAPGPAAIPARPYLGISEENREDLEAIADEYYERLISEA